MQLGNILTEQQMKEYQELQEEPSEKTQNNDMPRGRRARKRGPQWWNGF